MENSWTSSQIHKKATKAIVPEGVAVFAKWPAATGLFHRRNKDLNMLGEGEDDGVQE